MDQRSANGGKSSGPILAADPWDAFADDQLGLMDHLGIKRFLFMGYCIGGCFALKLMERSPELLPRRPDLTMEQVERYLHDLYRVRPEFVYSVSPDFARSKHQFWSCRTKLRPIHSCPPSMSPHSVRTPR